MATHDYVIDNQTAPNFRADLNSALQAIVTQNSSGTAPSVTYANMIWYDSANNQLKKRDEANSGWITLGTIDEGTGTFTPSGGSSLGVTRRYFEDSTLYTPPTGVTSIYIQVFGASGGITSTASNGGVGGIGYAERVYTKPFTGAPYVISIGAGGTSAGTSGGTTSFGSVSVTGSGGVTTTSGSAGGVASGGDFNASGGAGGTGRSDATIAGGGGGGAGSRAGNGGTGGNAGSGTGGGGGGTGGNNASGSTAGAASTTTSASAVLFPTYLVGEKDNVFYDLGANAVGAAGGRGASAQVFTTLDFPFGDYSATYLGARPGGVGAQNGNPGFVTVWEIY
jgi:hypothetical protein